jgi:hypothetical protein
MVDTMARSAQSLDLDPETEQLYDELLARIVAIADIVPSSRVTIGPLATHRELVVVASQAVTALRCRRDPDAAEQLIRGLWPTHTAPHAAHPWWSTPLGRLLAIMPAPDDTKEAPEPAPVHRAEDADLQGARRDERMTRGPSQQLRPSPAF